MKWIFLAAALLFSNILTAQVVNIESQRMHTDSVRRSGEFNFDYSHTNINSKTLSVLNSTLSLQQKSKDLKSIWLILGSANISKAKDEDFENASFFHLRFNRKIAKPLRWEVFTQVQSNLPIGIRLRYLAGTGPRFKLISNKNFNLYLGSLYMYELEKTIDSAKHIQHFNRNSSYLSFSFAFPSINAELVSTTYYQPNFADISDFRVFTENRLELSITKKLKALTSFNYFYDSRPPLGINNYTTSFDQGFGWRF
ncbi:MAG: DUF481 domain-containing protein [Ferruginibacter sp.]